MDRPGHNHRRTRQGLIVSAVVVFGALVLSACGSSNPPPPSTTSSTSPPTSSTGTTASTTTTLAIGPPCTTALLNFSASFGGAAAGGNYYKFEATNTGPSACSLEGYPKVTLYGPSSGGGTAAGPELPISAVAAGPAPATVPVAPKSSAEFILLFTDVPVNGSGCSTVASVDVSPPGNTEVTAVPLSFSPCGATVRVYAFGPADSESP